jgi:hypothetical protein
MKATRPHIRKKKDKPWRWPFQRYNDGPEYACRHGVGHSEGVHGCEGCCSDPNFPKESKWPIKRS